MNDQPAQKSLPLPYQVQRLNSIITGLHASINNLSKQLTPVRTLAPAEPKADSAEMPSPVSISEQLSRHNSRLEDAVKRIEQLKGELEV